MQTDGTESRGSKKRVTVIMPAYNAELTLRRTYNDIPKDAVDEIILVDDASQDRTLQIARELGLVTYAHDRNRGYGANQKTCFARALERGADVVVMVHPDHQYDPRVIPDLVGPLLRDECDAVFGSRMLGGRPLDGRMPTWKYLGNIFLSAIENAVFLVYLTEYHSGFRAYSRRYLEAVRFDLNSDGFVFDTEIIAQGIASGMKIREIAIETRYFDEASSIGFNRSVLYGLRILKTLMKFMLHRAKIWEFGQFAPAAPARGRWGDEEHR